MNRISHWLADWRFRIGLALSANADAAATRRIVHVFQDGTVLAPGKGYDKSRELYRQFQIEHTRLGEYRDAHIAVQESPVVDLAIRSLAEDCTAEPFTWRVKSGSRRAHEELRRLFDRIGYFGQKRAQILARSILTGDHFAALDKNNRPARKRNLRDIEDVRTLREASMFRLDDEYGMFRDPARAYLQLPGVELLPASVWIKDLVTGSHVWGGVSPYAGLAGVLAGKEYRLRGADERFFSVEDILHSRVRPLWRESPTGYGVGALRSSMVTHNIVMMNTQDLAIGRKLATMNRLNFNLDAQASQESFNALKAMVESAEPNPAQQWVTQGVEVRAVDAQNRQLSNLDDLWLFIDLLGMVIGCPLALVGFGAHRMNSGIMERMEQRYKRTTAFWNQWEEWELIRPVAFWQLYYAGLGDEEVEFEFPEVSFEDTNKRTKRELSKVQATVKSRRKAAMLLDKLTVEEFEEDFRQIEKEMTSLGPIQKYQPDGESLEKGKKGVEGKDPAEQDIADTEGTGDED